MSPAEPHRLIPIQWRTGPPSGRGDSLYQFVRVYLAEAGGSCDREALLVAMTENPVVRQKLEAGQGFRALLTNMRHSGQVQLDGQLVKLTSRALRRVPVHR